MLYHQITKKINNARDAFYSDEVEEALSQFLEIEKDSSITPANLLEVVNMIGECHLKLDQPAEALRRFEQAVSLGISNWLTKKQTLNSMAQALTKLSRYPEAISVYQEVVSLEKNHDSLDFIDNEIYEVIRDFDSYLKHGSVKERQQKLLTLLETTKQDMITRLAEKEKEGQAT